jgi:hypothetical protein
MKKVLIAMLVLMLCPILYAQECNEYNWTMTRYTQAASSVWDICQNKIDFQFTCTSPEFFFAYSLIVIAQSGKQWEADPDPSSDTEMRLIFDCDNWGDIKQGVTCTGQLDRFPQPFNIFIPFRIYYDTSYIDVEGAPVLISTSTSIPPTTSTTTLAYEGMCPAELIYGEGSREAEMLRIVRDTVLSKTPEGQELIRLYYLWSPVLVRLMEDDPGLKEDVKTMLDELTRP